MESGVYWLELAQNKLEDIYAYYTIRASKKVAQRLVNGIIDTTIGIEKQPEIGQFEISLKHRPQEFRYLVFENYNSKRVEIANVFDTGQDPFYINETN